MTLQEILLEAGYSANSAKQQMNTMLGLRQHIDPLIEKMEAHREQVMERLDRKIVFADYADLVRSLHTLNHDIRLLTGKSTSNIGVVIADRRAQIDRLIDE